MKMKALLLILSCSLLLLPGCAVDMRKIPSTARDQEKYSNPCLDANKSITDKRIPYYVVIKTKASHKYAQINAGKNISLREGIKIEFLDLSVRNGKKYARPFAVGRVVAVEENTSWVEIYNPEKSCVMENHFAAVKLDQSKTIIEKADPSHWFNLQ